MAEHGTRTMYVHYGCRCDDCCRAEHAQYLKRAEAKKRKRVHSKWSLPGEAETADRKERTRQYAAERYKQISLTHAYKHRIRWQAVSNERGLTCAICGCQCDPLDFWIGENGKKHFGKRYPTIDHIVPLSLGGTDCTENAQLLCKSCNSAKGARKV